MKVKRGRQAVNNLGSGNKEKNFTVHCPAPRMLLFYFFQWLALSGMADFRAVAFLAALAISGEQHSSFNIDRKKNNSSVSHMEI